jgi:hypothetical protein
MCPINGPWLSDASSRARLAPFETDRLDDKAGTEHNWHRGSTIGYLEPIQPRMHCCCGETR